MPSLQPHCPVRYGFVAGQEPPQVPERLQEVGRYTASYDERVWIFHRQWEPPTDQPVVATLTIVHGTVDHSGVYEELATRLASNGIAVFAIDMRGWGMSDGERMYMDDMSTYVKDVDALYRQVHGLERYKDVKHRFLLGKSIGGTVTANCILTYPDHWTGGYIGLSGAYQIDENLKPSPYVVPILNLAASWLVPKLPFKQLFDEHLIVKDEHALQAWRDDDLCSKDKITLGYIVNLLDSVEQLQDQVSKINIPMLMMYGTDDKVVTKSGHEMMIEKNLHSDKELKLYDGGYHNLLAEPTIKDNVIRDIQDWILKHSK